MARTRLVMFDLDGTLIEGFLTERWECPMHGDSSPPEARECVECGHDLSKRVVSRYDHPYEKVTVLPGVRDKLLYLASIGTSFAVCTNQGGVALGYQTPGEVWSKMGRSVRALNSFYGRPYSLHVAMHAPTQGRNPLWEHPVELRRRKPEPGMLFEALDFHADQLGAEPRARSLYVGDMESDRKAAEAAGVPFEWAQEFFA